MLILTDRTRQETGLKDCMRDRWWKFHAVDGYGISSKAAALDASVGIGQHMAVAGVLQAVALGGHGGEPAFDPEVFARGPLVNARGERRVVTDEETAARRQARAIVRRSIAWLEEQFRSCNLWFGEPGDRRQHEYLLREQSALMEGLYWGWLRGQLPNFLKLFKILAVEREEGWVEGCTCGLGQAIQGEAGVGFKDHDDRGCQGVGHQARPDFVLERRSDGLVGIHDLKGHKTMGEYDINRYRVSIQMAANTLCVEARLGVQVTHYYIHVMLKGQRSASYEPQTKTFTGPKRQQSMMTYNEYLAPAPPIRPSDEVGASNLQWYKRVPTWEISFAHKPEEWSNAEYLVSLMTLPEVQKNYVLVGPYDRQTWLCKRYMRQMGAEEQRWLDRVWAVYDLVQGGMDIEDALDLHVPQSWDCMKYGSEGGQCEFLPICLGEGVSARDPMASGLYVPRVPHHEYEEWRKRGLVK